MQIALFFFPLYIKVIDAQLSAGANLPSTPFVKNETERNAPAVLWTVSSFLSSTPPGVPGGADRPLRARGQAATWEPRLRAEALFKHSAVQLAHGFPVSC